MRVLLLSVSAVAVSPLEKVVEMLNTMHQTGTKELNEEQKEAAAFSQNCDDTQARLKKEIQKFKDDIADQDAKIAKQASAADGLAVEIGQLTEEMRLDAADFEAAKRVRGLESTDFLAQAQDYGESLAALARAISVLSNKQVTNKEVVAIQTSLLQIKSHTKSVSAVASALKQSQPQGETYGYQSAMDGVISMLKDLEEKFKGEELNLQKEEKASSHAFELLNKGHAKKKEDDRKTVNRKMQEKGDHESKGAKAQGEKDILTEDLSATNQDYRQTKSSCSRNNALYKKQNELRIGELAAIKTAVGILQGDAVGAAAANIKYHGEEAESFIQLVGGNSDAIAKDKVLRLLNTKSTTLKSKMLSALSMRVRVSPFKKVLKMIRDMVSRLQDQAVKEAAAHGWCEAKKAETKLDLEDKQASQASLTSEGQELAAKRDQLTDAITELTNEIANLSRDRGEAANTRAQNKAENTRVIEESVEGQKAVAKAIQVLNEFYAKGAAHQESDEGAGAVTEIYGGQQDKNAGVIDILKVVESDFAREEAQRTAAEAQQADDYKKLMNSSEVDVEVKKSEKQHKSQVLVDTKKELRRCSDELADTNETLEVITKQKQELETQCSAQVSFEDRQKLRENEIQSLKEALQVLRNIP